MSAEPSYVTQKYLADNTIEDRDYQTKLVENASQESSLIALPTGTGKTPVAIRIAMRRLEAVSGRILMLAPTQPLVEQHKQSFLEMTTIPENEIQIFNGNVRPKKREERWGEANSIIIATPQVIENDLLGNRYDLSNVCHLIFDECHRATGDYSYNFIAERYTRDASAEMRLVTAMSASPGSDRDAILSVCQNLHLNNIEVITEDDPSLKKYLSTTDFEYTWVDIPDEILDAIDLLKDAYQDAQAELKDRGVLNSARKDQSIKAINGCMEDIAKLKNSDETAYFKCMSYAAEARKLSKAVESAERGVSAGLRFLRKIEQEANSSNGSKASQRIAGDAKVKKAKRKLEAFDGIHPKLVQTAVEVNNTVGSGGKVLVFTENRATVSEIVDFLNQNENLTVDRFVGQSDTDHDAGMTQTEQKTRLKEFRDGDVDVLVSTSVAEEGLDIPAVDLVLVYEPVPNSIRDIQRSGRTGREKDGRVVMLIGEGTSDVGKYYTAKNRTEQMKSDIKDLQQIQGDIMEEIHPDEDESQPGLSDFTGHDSETTSETLSEGASPEPGGDADENDGVEGDGADRVEVESDSVPTPGDVDWAGEVLQVLGDSRELNSEAVRELDRMEDVEFSVVNNMEVGDYIVSDETVVERKTGEDLLDTIIGERGFGQIKEAVKNYENVAVFVEEDGLEDLFSIRNIHPNAIRGALASMQLDFGVSVYFTGDGTGTAEMLVALAKREQIDRGRDVSEHGEKETGTVPDKQKYVVSALPSVGPSKAVDLLEHENFGSVSAVMTASKSELMDVDGVGEKTAEAILEVTQGEYRPDSF